VTEVKIDPEVVDKNDVEMLQDLITAAVNEASRKVDQAAEREIGALAGNLPGLF
jgi:DNA-binding protein YbaB